jgi:uncharacterized membrane protein YhaH (DUF805 family)
MKAMEWMLMPLRRYADFQGRSRRKEYWFFYLFTILVWLPIYLLYRIIGAIAWHGGGLFGILLLPVGLALAVVLLGLFIPSLAVQVRRFHDQDKSGWFILLGLIPVVGGIILLVFNCLEGTSGPNRYGPDPKLDVNATFS